MKININYFTSTGNTIWVLDKLCINFQRLGHEVQIFDSVIYRDNMPLDCDLLGFVFPVWGSDLPKPQRDLIENLADGNNMKVFLIGNAGMDAWDTGVHIAKKLKSKGYNVIYTGNVILPMNSSFPGLQFIKKRAPKKSALMFEYADNTLKKACKSIFSGKKFFECKGIRNKIGGITIRMVYGTFVSIFKKKYYVDHKKCNGCGLCYSICPEGAISIIEEKAIIDTSKCIFCLKCYNYCPQTAVLKSKKSSDIIKYPRYKGLEKYNKPIKYR